MLKNDKPMNYSKSYLSQVMDALIILNLQEPVDAKTLSELVGLTPKQTSQCLSRLHQTGYLAQVGTHNRYACFILKKPLKEKAVSVQRAHRHHLIKRTQWEYKDVKRHIASKIAHAVIRGREKELACQAWLAASTGPTGQFALFGLEKR
jgi:DNA-binding IclR family transcriptional regulator